VTDPRSDAAIVRLPPSAAPSVVDAFCDAFRDYPVMRFVLGESGADYAARLRTLIGFFVAARALRGEPLLGVPFEDGLQAAATASFPGVGEEPLKLGAVRDAAWAELGDDARARYAACGEAWGRFDVGVPHVHLNMIGVRGAFRGTGLARRLMDHVHALSLETPGSRGVTLSTESPTNVQLYEHVGYEVVGQARIAPTLETWIMFRRD
jgi:GNAT superfamily N-acetyltransferase